MSSNIVQTYSDGSYQDVYGNRILPDGTYYTPDGRYWSPDGRELQSPMAQQQQQQQMHPMANQGYVNNVAPQQQVSYIQQPQQQQVQTFNQNFNQNTGGQVSQVHDNNNAAFNKYADNVTEPEVQQPQMYDYPHGQNIEEQPTALPIMTLALDGNEFKPFVIGTDVEIEKTIIGEYHKFEVKGDIDMNVVSVDKYNQDVKVGVVSDILVPSDNALKCNLTASAINSNKDVIIASTTFVEEVVSINIAPKFVHEIIMHADSVYDIMISLRDKLLASAGVDKKALKAIDKYLTSKVNKIVKATIVTTFSIDSFAEDYQDLLDTMKSSTDKAAYKVQVDKMDRTILKVLKNDYHYMDWNNYQTVIIEKDSTVSPVVLCTESPVIYVNGNEALIAAFDTMKLDDTALVSKIYSESLNNIVEDIFNGKKGDVVKHQVEYIRVITDNVACEIHKNVYGSYTVLRVA